MIATHAIEHDHIERCGGRSLLIEATHVEPIHIRAPVNDLVNSPRIAMERKHNGFVFREMFYETLQIQSMGMQFGWIHRHQVYHVDHSHFQFWNVMA